MLDSSNIPEMPGGEAIQKTIDAFNKKAAGAMIGMLKRALATSSMPVFRRDIGERFFTADSMIGGVFLWGIGTVLSCWLTGTLIGSVLALLHLNKGTAVFRGPVIPFLAGAAFIIFYIKAYCDNSRRLTGFRNEGKLYHTMSRGVPRWDNPLIPLLLWVALILLVPFVAVALVIACSVSAKLANEQQAIIYSRYLDALDQKIEKEFLEAALLGKCPPEITYLARPLPANLNPGVANDIAAAAVGKPVAVVAKGPRKREGETPCPANDSAPQTTSQSETSPNQPAQQPMSNSLLAAAGVIAVVHIFRWFLGFKRVRYSLLGVSLLLMGLWAYNHYHSDRPGVNDIQKSRQMALEKQKQREPEQAEQARIIPNQSLDRSERILSPEPVQPKPSENAQAILAAEAARAEAQKKQARELAYAQLSNSLNTESNTLLQFVESCNNRLDSITNQIATASRFRRKVLGQNYQDIVKVATSYARRHNDYFRQTPDKLQAHFADQTDPAELKTMMDRVFLGMLSDRQYITNLLNALDAQLTNPRAQIQFRPEDEDSLKRLNF